jgi:arabinose-5-phosphate isomerase
VGDLRSITVDTVMSRSPRSIGAQALAVEGVALMEQHRINQLPVVDADNRVVGALNMHDLFAAGVV